MIESAGLLFSSDFTTIRMESAALLGMTWNDMIDFFTKIIAQSMHKILVVELIFVMSFKQ